MRRGQCPDGHEMTGCLAMIPEPEKVWEPTKVWSYPSGSCRVRTVSQLNKKWETPTKYDTAVLGTLELVMKRQGASGRSAGTAVSGPSSALATFLGEARRGFSGRRTLD